jgi:hypothetical protein
VVKGLQPLLVDPRVVGGVQTLLGRSRSEHVQTILLVIPSGGTGSDGGSDGAGDVEVSWGGLGGGGRGSSLWAQARSLASNLMGDCGWWMQLGAPIFELPSDLGAGGFGSDWHTLAA